MKKILFSFALLAAVVLSSSCDEGTVKTSFEGQQIAFMLEGEGIDLNVSTKATAVTTVSTVYWEAKQSGTVKHAVASYSVSSGTVNTGKYWTLGASYDYMVANVAFTTSTGAISATNATDIVVGTASGVTGNSCSVTLNHIFARTGTLTLNPQSGYEISDISWKIKAKGSASGTAGTYTIGTGWAATATTSLSEQAFTGSSDLYLIPGSYTITVSYKLKKGGYEESFTKSADVTLVAGKKNNITGTATGGSASEIAFSVTVTPWGDNDITLTLS